MLWKCARPKVGAPQEAQNVGLIQLGVAMWCNQLGMHLWILGPVHVAVHVMDGMIAIVAGKVVDHRSNEVSGGVHVHLGTLVFSQDDVLCAIVLQHIPQLE